MHHRRAVTRHQRTVLLAAWSLPALVVAACATAADAPPSTTTTSGGTTPTAQAGGGQGGVGNTSGQGGSGGTTDPCEGDTGAHRWSAGPYGAQAYEMNPRGLVVDGAGDVIVGGFLSGSSDFGCGPLDWDGLGDGFVVKLDGTTHACLWNRSVIGTPPHGVTHSRAQSIEGVAVDDQGHVYAAGHFQKDLDFDGDGTAEATAQGFFDAFVVKLDGATGDLLWLQTFGDPAASVGAWGVGADSAGRVFVTGMHRGTATFGSTELTTSSYDEDYFDILVLRLDGATGEVVWATLTGGEDNEWGEFLAIGRAGQLLVGGAAWSDAVQAPTDFFVAKYDTPTGALVWNRIHGSDSADRTYLTGIGGLGDGDVAVGGYFIGNLDLGQGSLSAGQSHLASFVARLAGATGDEVWARSFGGNTPNATAALGSLATDGCDTIGITGYFDVALDFGLAELTTTALHERNAFVAKLDGGGDVLWAFGSGSGADLDDDQQGSVIGLGQGAMRSGALAGQFRGTVDFGGEPVVSTATGPIAFDLWVTAFEP